MGRGVLKLTCTAHLSYPNPSLPPSASPAEATVRTTIFLYFFQSLIFLSNGCFLASPGISKSTQNRLLCQKLAPQADFLVTFWPFLRLPCFLVVRGSIFDDFSTFFSMHFSMSVSVFPKPPNLQIYWQGQYFQLFSGFLFLVFF